MEQPSGWSQCLLQGLTLTMPGSLCEKHLEAGLPRRPKEGTVSHPPGWPQTLAVKLTMSGSLWELHRDAVSPRGPKVAPLLQPQG